MNVLIAINFHAFHTIEELKSCCESVALAMSKTSPEFALNAKIFHNVMRDSVQLDPDTLCALQFDVISLVPGTNGQGLNQQIEYANIANFDLMCRVDADDLVDEWRFVRQLELIRAHPNCDIFGGGLLYHNTDTGNKQLILPPRRPTSLDFFLNQYCLHPTFAFRLPSVGRELRYWSKRVEDKRFILDSKVQGLTFLNDQFSYGTYQLNQATRSNFRTTMTNFSLNLSWAIRFSQLLVLPAIMIFMLSLVTPLEKLRSLRVRILKLAGLQLDYIEFDSKN